MVARVRVGLLVALVLVAVACGGAEEGAGEPSVTEAAPVSTPAADDSGRPTFTERRALLSTPEEDAVQASMGDLDVAADLAGIDWPPAEDDDAIVDALLALTAPRLDEGTPPVWLPLPTLANVTGAGAQQTAFAEGAGWSLMDLDWYAEAVRVPHSVMVGAGRVSPERLQEVHGGPAEGPWRTSGAEDLETDLEGDRLLDPLGRPLTMVVHDGTLGVSLIGGALETLSGEGPSLAEEEELAALTGLADAEGCYAIAMSLDQGVAQLVCQLPDLDGGAALLLASTGGDDPEAAATAVRDAAEGGDSGRGGDYEDLVTDVEVAVEDDLVVVRLRVVEGPAGVGHELLITRDPLMPAG